MTRTIKLTNQRQIGSLYHFAHFMTDCLLPEILAGVHGYDRVLRQRTIYQTIGNFHTIYTEVMGVEYAELLPEDFNAHEGDELVIDTRGHENTVSSQDLETFRAHIFSLPGFGRDRLLPGGEPPRRLAFWRRKRPAAEPDILLIKRYARIELLSDPALKDINPNATTGKERREIAEIDRVEQHLRKIYGDRVRAVHLEFVPFADQVLYFAKASLIVAAHGAALSNMLFCRPGTRIIEVTCGVRWAFFDTISGLLGLEHVKCRENTFAAVARCIAENPV